MPEQHYTATEAAAYLKVSRWTLYTWLHKEPELYSHLQEHHTLTQRQLDALVIRQRKKPAKPTLQEVDEALTERMEALEADMRTVKQHLEALEASRMPYRAPRMPTDVSGNPSTHASAFSDAPERHFSFTPRTAGALMKSDAARLVADRHGVAFNTAKGWPWPPSALSDADAALRWALDYVARNPRQHPAGWRALCNVPECPCHEHL